MKTISLSKASRPLAEYAADLGGEIVVLTQRNRPVAAIVPLKPSDRESVALSGHPEFLELIARSRADVRSGRVASLEEMRRLFPVERPPNRRLQPAKARRKPVVSRGARKRLRG